MASDTKSNSQGLPRIAIVVAMTKNRVIGSRGNLPWHLPEDLQLFKQLTTGGTLIMGRKTYESIGKPLPGRNNLVLSHHELDEPGIKSYNSFIAGVIAATQLGRPIYVIGGAEIYRKTLPLATELHVSWVKKDYAGDTYFPEISDHEWQESKTEAFEEFTYIRYQRR